MQSLLSKAGKVSLLQFAEQFLQICFFIGLSRICELKLLGTYMALTAFWTLGSMMIDFGLNHVLIKESAQQKDIFAISAMVISVKGVGMCILFAGLFIWSFFSESLFVLTLVYTLPVIGVRCIGSALSSVIIGQGNIFTIAVCQFCARVLLVAFVGISLWSGSGIEYAVLIHFIVESLLLCLFWWILGRPGWHPIYQWNFEKCRQLCKAGAIIGLTTSGILLLLRQPLFRMEYFSSDQTVLYGLAVRAIELLLIPVNTVLLISLPHAVKYKNRSETAILKDRYTYSFFQNLKPIFFLFISLSILNKFFISFPLCAIIALKLAPLDQVLWSIFITAGLLTILYSVCFDLFVMEKLYIAMWVIALVNVIVAVVVSGFFGAAMVSSLEGGLNISNLSLALAVSAIYIIKYFYRAL
jgi:O-antigen/teichoic acid export membrane protein